MAADEQIAPPYSYYLQGEWTQIVALSISLRKKILMKETDEETIADFGARLSRYWLEIKPKINGSDFPDKMTFLSYEKFCTDPYAVFEGKNEKGIPKETITKLFTIESILRDALEHLKITTW